MKPLATSNTLFLSLIHERIIVLRVVYEETRAIREELIGAVEEPTAEGFIEMAFCLITFLSLFLQCPFYYLIDFLFFLHHFA